MSAPPTHQQPTHAHAHARALLLHAPHTLMWTDEPLPEVTGDAVLVATTFGAVSVGAELSQYRGTSRHSTPLPLPRMTGYESVGRVLATGPDATHLPGARVVGTWGHRTHAVVPSAKAILVPDAISDALALLAILSCDVEKGLRRIAPQPADAALVTGGGTIGLLAVWLLRQRGLRQITLSEPDPARRALALRLGASAALHPADLPAEPLAVQVGVECSSRSAAFADLQAQLTHGGRIAILADGNLEPLTLTPHFHERELQIVASSDGWDYTQHAAWLFAMLANDPAARAELESLYDWRIPAADLPDAFARMAAAEQPPLKVLVAWEP